MAAVPSQQELDFIKSFDRFTLSNSDTLPAACLAPKPFHKSFFVFPNLLPEIRNQIWELTLPGPRILLIQPVKTNMPFTWPESPPEPVEYVASPCSYGGAHPVALSVCRESRGEALRILTEKFHAYWNLSIDTAYVEVKRWKSREGIDQILDMQARGLWAGFKRVAADIDVLVAPKYCIDLVRTSHEITHFYFICRFRNWHRDVVDPGVAWYLVDGSSVHQTEFRKHKDWCHVIMMYQSSLGDYVNKDVKENEGGWMTRPFQPSMEMMIIEGRKMEELEPGTRHFVVGDRIPDADD